MNIYGGTNTPVLQRKRLKALRSFQFGTVTVHEIQSDFKSTIYLYILLSFKYMNFIKCYITIKNIKYLNFLIFNIECVHFMSTSFSLKMEDDLGDFVYLFLKLTLRYCECL